MGGTKRQPQGPFASATRTLRLFRLAENPFIKAIEERLAGASGLGLAYMGPLCLVAASPQLGLNDRGCGPKSAHVCLSKESEVSFPRRGIRLILEEGDLLMWPNVNWDTDEAVEDMRTIRTHRTLHNPAAGTAGNERGRNQAELPVLGVDALFHDNPIREQQARRHF